MLIFFSINLVDLKIVWLWPKIKRRRYISVLLNLKVENTGKTTKYKKEEEKVQECNIQIERATARTLSRDQHTSTLSETCITGETKKEWRHKNASCSVCCLVLPEKNRGSLLNALQARHTSDMHTIIHSKQRSWSLGAWCNATRGGGILAVTARLE